MKVYVQTNIEGDEVDRVVVDAKDRVRVRLTPLGAAYWGQFAAVPSTGIVECELFELMRVFGPHISVGADDERVNVFFERNEIAILSKRALP